MYPVPLCEAEGAIVFPWQVASDGEGVDVPVVECLRRGHGEGLGACSREDGFRFFQFVPPCE